jgi:hypothetical protein
MSNADRAVGAAETAAFRDVPVDWEALEDAFENNAPEVHSYLQLGTGEVLRVVDGIADPEMHARISTDAGYLRVDPVSSREQYRWMERFIPMIEEGELRDKLTQAIDGKGAFRRFKDVLMAHAPERERWFAFRSERLRVFMEAWLGAHALRPVLRPVYPAQSPAPGTTPAVPGASPMAQDAASRRARNAEALRRQLREIAEGLGMRDLEKVTAFAEFVSSRRPSHVAEARSEHGPESEDFLPPSEGADGPESDGPGEP